MPDIRQFVANFVDTLRTGVGFLKSSPRSTRPLTIAAILFFVGRFSEDFFPTELASWLQQWNGLLWLQKICYTVGIVSGFLGLYRLCRFIFPPPLPPPADRPSAIKGPMHFATEDGALFAKLGRQEETRRLLGWVLDDQFPMIAVFGPSGVGKTSLLRAGLPHVLSQQHKEFAFHYWEALPDQSESRLLRAVSNDWGDPRLPDSLDALVNPARELCTRRHVIVIDQLEQLACRSVPQCPIFRLLRRVAREARPPHLIRIQD